MAAYRAALLERFANPRMRHRLAQIAADGSQKLPVRILPVLRAGARRRPDARGRDPRAGRLGVPPARRRGAGRAIPALPTIVPLAAGSLPDAVRRVARDPRRGLAEDGDVVAAVIAQAEPICAQAR